MGPAQHALEGGPDGVASDEAGYRQREKSPLAGRRYRTRSRGKGLLQYSHLGCSATAPADWSTRAPHSGQVAGTVHSGSS